MFVCVCNAVSDRQIRAAVDLGAGSLAEVQCRLPVANCCGHCEDTARQVVDEHLGHRAQRQSS